MGWLLSHCLYMVTSYLLAQQYKPNAAPHTAPFCEQTVHLVWHFCLLLPNTILAACHASSGRVPC